MTSVVDSAGLDPCSCMAYVDVRDALERVIADGYWLAFSAGSRNRVETVWQILVVLLTNECIVLFSHFTRTYTHKHTHRYRYVDIFSATLRETQMHTNTNKHTHNTHTYTHMHT